MASAQQEQLGILNQEIAETTAKIETEKLELKELYVASGGKSTDQIKDIKESLTDLRKKETTLLAERKTITDALTQPNQGTSTRARNHHRFPFNLCREGGRGSRDFGKEQRAGVHLEPCSLS